VGGAQLLAGVDAAVLAAQPLSVEEVGAGPIFMPVPLESVSSRRYRRQPGHSRVELTGEQTAPGITEDKYRSRNATRPTCSLPSGCQSVGLDQEEMSDMLVTQQRGHRVEERGK
jgi:hypothetical protein